MADLLWQNNLFSNCPCPYINNPILSFDVGGPLITDVLTKIFGGKKAIFNATPIRHFRYFAGSSCLMGIVRQTCREASAHK